MNKRSPRAALATGLSGLALACSMMFALAAPATAVTSVAELVDTCRDQTVCLYDGASISDPGAVTSSLPEGVRVVVIPQPDQAESLPSTAIASQVRALTGSDTVIIIEDRPVADRFAVSSKGDEKEITSSLYSQGEDDGGTAVLAVASTLASSSNSAASTGGGANSSDGGVVFAAFITFLLVGAAVGTTVMLLRRRGKRAINQVEGSRRLEKELAAALNGENGEFVQRAIERLRERAQAYPDLSGWLSQLSQHVAELFIRVRKRGTDQQVRLLQAQYHDTLAKLLKALEDDYYGDILRNPQYWSGPNERLAEVRRAVEAVDQEAVENIKQVNESRDLEFKVALDSLIKTVSEAKLSDVYTDREQ